MQKIAQSPDLKTFFTQEIEKKRTSQTQEIYAKAENNPLGYFAVGIHQFKNFKNQVQGNIGESFIALLLSQLPKTWAMGKNIFIPTHSKKLTEIDLLIVGTKGIFLLEIKTWKGSFSAYRDRWKRRGGSRWIPLQNSPTQQSLYHQKAFQTWLDIQNLSIDQNAIIAPVIFPAAQWVGIKHCSVPVITALSELNRLIAQRKDYLDNLQIEAIVNALQEIAVPMQQTDPQKPTLAKSKPILKKKHHT
ncbi:nuclease-related domain-containing protein [Picosynechococcus sp. PCC 8807]|uniref:nuclease-related domain-containing protein n=1 Tax=Picosynechococcus sp. PCC 8807 TaxID=195248 RepID=UPI000810ED01|nr:nuclease-related domain-containing protein [Picosynechococcus sp. PCC 8807]ANV89368.1 hypothetical protein AWQ24_01180 [Picosynechococcus sp. PCC 8807]